MLGDSAIGEAPIAASTTFGSAPSVTILAMERATWRRIWSRIWGRVN